MTWRVGRKLGRTLYRDEVFVGTVDSNEIADAIVQTMNREPPAVDDGKEAAARAEFEATKHNAGEWERTANRYLADRNDLRDRAVTASRSLKRARDTARRAKQLWEEGKESKGGDLLDLVLRELETAVRAIETPAAKQASAVSTPPTSSVSLYPNVPGHPLPVRTDFDDDEETQP